MRRSFHLSNGIFLIIFAGFLRVLLGVFGVFSWCCWMFLLVLLGVLVGARCLCMIGFDSSMCFCLLWFAVYHGFLFFQCALGWSPFNAIIIKYFRYH